MTNTELILNMLAEAATTDLSKEKSPNGFKENAFVAHQGGKVARVARQQLESQLGHSIVSSLNAKQGLRQIEQSTEESDNNE